MRRSTWAAIGLCLLSLLVAGALAEEAKQQGPDAPAAALAGGKPAEQQAGLNKIVYRPKQGEGVPEPEYQGHRKELPLRKHTSHDHHYNINPDNPYEPAYPKPAPKYPDQHYDEGEEEEQEHYYRRDEEPDYKPKPHYGYGNGGGGPNPGGLPTFENLPCLNTVDQVAEAFSRGDVSRCVDDNILVRIDQYFLPLDKTTKQAMFENFRDSRQKTLTFWSYSDNVEKYIRIGRSALKLGNFVDVGGDDKGLQDANFQGIKDLRNFAALLEAIGYGSSSTNPKKAYVFIVTERPAPVQEGVPTAVYIPTWRNLLTYIEYYVSKLALPDAGARARAGISDADIPYYANFRFNPQTLKQLETKTYAELTGCKAQCTLQDTNYGLPGDTTWTTPTIDVPRLNETTCDVAGRPKPRYELTEPTILNSFDAFCDPIWRDVKRQYDNSLCGAPNLTNIHYTTLQMAKLYREAGGDTLQTFILRAYLETGCAGSSNSLFSGNGLTYTGNGGFLGGTGRELHTGQTLPSQMPAVFPRVRLSFFCPYGQDGIPFTRSECPASLGDFTPPPGWDVREVKV